MLEPRVASCRRLPLGLLLAALAAAIVLATAPPSDARVTNQVKKACAGDYKRLCPRYKVGSSQLRACMEAKQAEISWSCVQALIDSGMVDRRRAGR